MIHLFQGVTRLPPEIQPWLCAAGVLCAGTLVLPLDGSAWRVRVKILGGEDMGGQRIARDQWVCDARDGSRQVGAVLVLSTEVRAVLVGVALLGL